MKSLVFFHFLLSLVFITSCSKPAGKSSRLAQGIPAQELSSQPTSVENSEQEQEQGQGQAVVSITMAPMITNANVSQYLLVGECNQNGQPVDLTISSLSFQVTCQGNSFQLSQADLSTLSEGEHTWQAIHQDDQGLSSSSSKNVTKSTLTAFLSVVQPSAIHQVNQTAYALQGNCSENTQTVTIDLSGILRNVTCQSGSWNSGLMDLSSLSDGDLQLNITHQSAPAINQIIQKNTSGDLVTLSQVSPINTQNQTQYRLSGTCSQSAADVTISIAQMNLTVTCNNLNTWSTELMDLSAIADGEIAINISHASATSIQTNTTKQTQTLSISQPTVSVRYDNALKIHWNIINPSNEIVSDHNIQYRISGTSTWLSNSQATAHLLSEKLIENLQPSTLYDFRVRVINDQGVASSWSSIFSGSTQPQSDLFGAHKLINLGGSTDTKVAAHFDNTQITLNGVALVTLNQGEVHRFTSAQFDVLDADKPIYAAGLRSEAASGSQGSGNIVWQPTSWADRSFVFSAYRDNAQKLIIYAIEDTTIQLKQGTQLIEETTLLAHSGTVLTWSQTGSFQVHSTGSILAYHYSASTNEDKIIDPKPLLSPSFELLGIPSRRVKVSTLLSSANVMGLHSDDHLETMTLTLDSIIEFFERGSIGLFKGNALLISSDQKVAGATYADQNGNCATPFMPTHLLKTHFVINSDSDFVAFASKGPGQIEVYDPQGTLLETLTLQRTGTNSNAPYQVRTQTYTSEGTRFISSVPVTGVYQPNNNLGSADQDETILVGTSSL